LRAEEVTSKNGATRAQAFKKQKQRCAKRSTLAVSYGQAVGDDALEAKEAADAERRLAIEALRAKRDELYRLRMSHQIDDSLHQRLVREIDLMDAALSRQRALISQATESNE